MQILLKVILSVAIILAATGVGKKLPSIAGLVGVMPLTGTLVLIWMYIENKWLAERQGFEPWVELSPYTRLAGERLQPTRPSLRLVMAEGVGFEPTEP